MIQHIDFAPLDGLTKAVFRKVWARHFGGAERYFMPFFSPVKERVVTARDRKELEADWGGLELVPQIMTKRAEDFLWAQGFLQSLGYGEVNLNLGCPSGTVTAKGKGSGFLAKPQQLDEFFEEVFARSTGPVSVKTRLGVADPEEFWQLLEIYNKYPITCLTIHPRVQKEHYKGSVHRDVFAKAVELSKVPLCYNGDLRTPEDLDAFEAEFPMIGRVMIGRGLLCDPAMLRKYHGGPAATKEEIVAFLDDLYESYKVFYGVPNNASQRMKEIWFYLHHLFAGSDHLDKKMRRCRSAREVELLQAQILAECPIMDHPEGEPV